MKATAWNRIVPVEEVDRALVEQFRCGDECMDSWFCHELPYSAGSSASITPDSF